MAKRSDATKDFQNLDLGDYIMARFGGLGQLTNLARIVRKTSTTYTAQIEGTDTLVTVSRKTGKTRGGNKRWWYCPDPDAVRQAYKRVRMRRIFPHLETTCIDDRLNIYKLEATNVRNRPVLAVFRVRPAVFYDDRYIGGVGVHATIYRYDAHGCMEQFDAYYAGERLDDALYDLLADNWDY